VFNPISSKFKPYVDSFITFNVWDPLLQQLNRKWIKIKNNWQRKTERSLFNCCTYEKILEIDPVLRIRSKKKKNENKK